MDTAKTTKPAETPVIEPIDTTIETVKEEPPETEETQTEPFMAITEESVTESAETETIITEPDPKQEPKEQKKETPQAETKKVESGGIVIGDPTPAQSYSCGVAGHHCTGPETHAYICELEQKGCEYCSIP